MSPGGAAAPGALGLRARLRLAGARLLPAVLFAVLPAAVVPVALAGDGGLHVAGDFYYAYWPAGVRLLHGASPFVGPASPQVAAGAAFVYPAVGALLLAPFSLLGHGTGAVVFTAVNLICAPATLWTLGVRDWRLYGLAVVCCPVLSSWLVGNVTLLLALGTAGLWRARDRPVVAGIALALLVSSKLLLWPLGIWLLATRRYAACAWAFAAGLAINLAAWAVLGFDEIERYRVLVRALADRRDDLGYSVVSVALRAGMEHGAAYALALALAGLAAAGCVALGRRGADVAALTLGLLACLLASPIVQLHYFALLLVPLALVRPRLGLPWLLPFLMWACVGGRAWQAVLAFALGLALVAVCVRPALPSPARRSRTVLRAA